MKKKSIKNTTQKINRVSKTFNRGWIAVLIIAIGSVILMESCKKKEQFVTQNTETEVDESNLIRIPEREGGPGIVFTWDEWGRKKFGCNRNGLCNFRIGTWWLVNNESDSTEVGSPIFSDASNNQYYIVVPVNDYFIKDSNIDNFYIDENLSIEYEGSTYTLLEGIYDLDESIEPNGGYKISINVD